MAKEKQKKPQTSPEAITFSKTSAEINLEKEAPVQQIVAYCHNLEELLN